MLSPLFIVYRRGGVLLLGHVHYKRGLILFMKKYILSGIVTLVCVISLISLQSARAAVTPTNGTTNVYTKVSSDAIATVVGQPQMSLSYDANHNESRLAAVFTVNITAGLTPINIYKRAYGMTLMDSHGSTVQANSLGNLTLVPQQAVAEGSDDYSQLFYIVPAGQTVRFTAVGSANPQELFAGTYRAAIISILANSTSLINNEFNLQFTNKIQTNAVTIVGETSPYIKSVTDPAIVGQVMTIRGQRLNNKTYGLDSTYIDNAPVQLVGYATGPTDGSSISFTLPKLSIGQHSVYVINDATSAKSNTVYFQVQVGTTTCNSYNFAVNLTFGSTGNDVAALQKLLIANGYHIADVENGFGVGFFGTSTKQAVAAFQAFAGINVAPEDLGFVGPLTRAALNALGCSTIQAPSITVLSPNGGEVINIGQSYTVKWSSSDSGKAGVELYVVNQATGKSYSISACCINAYAGQFVWPSIGQGLGETSAIPPGQYKLGINYYLTDSNTGKVDAKDLSDAPFTITSNTQPPCPVSGTAPVICGVTAPTQLNVGQQGTWTVQASDPQNGSLSYSVDWGDTGATACSPAVPQPKFVQTTTFTHGYCAAGVYNVTFTVTNTAGLSAKTSSTVNVVGNTSGNNPPKIVTSSSPAGSILVGTSYTFNWTASDVDNDNLSWGISSWGDGSPAQAGTCPSNLANSSFSASHTWMATGTYQIRVFVSDCKGGSDTAVQTVTVAPAIRVLSPNGGEVWNAGSVHSIRWLGNNQGRHISIRLNDYSAGFPAQTIIRDASAVWGSNPQDSRNVTEGFDYFAWNIPSDIRPGSQYQISVGDQTVNAPNFSNTDVSDAYFTIVGPSVNNAQANISLDPASPHAGIISISRTAQTLSVPLAIFDVKSQGTPATLRALTVRVGISKLTPQDLFSSIKIRAGSLTYAASSILQVTGPAFSDVAFTNLNIPLSADVVTPITVLADIAQDSTGKIDGTQVYATLAASNQTVVVEDPSFKALSVTTANILGNVQTLSDGDLLISKLTTVYGNKSVTPNGIVTQDFSFTFNVTAGNNPVYIPNSSTAFVFEPSIPSGDSVALVNMYDNVTSFDSPSYFYIAAGQTKTITAVYSVSGTGSGSLQIDQLVYGINSINLQGATYSGNISNYLKAIINFLGNNSVHYCPTTINCAQPTSVSPAGGGGSPVPSTYPYLSPTPTPKATTYSSSVWDAIMNWLSGR